MSTMKCLGGLLLGVALLAVPGAELRAQREGGFVTYELQERLLRVRLARARGEPPS